MKRLLARLAFVFSADARSAYYRRRWMERRRAHYLTDLRHYWLRWGPIIVAADYGLMSRAGVPPEPQEPAP